VWAHLSQQQTSVSLQLQMLAALINITIWLVIVLEFSLFPGNRGRNKNVRFCLWLMTSDTIKARGNAQNSELYFFRNEIRISLSKKINGKQKSWIASQH